MNILLRYAAKVFLAFFFTLPIILQASAVGYREMLVRLLQPISTLQPGVLNVFFSIFAVAWLAVGWRVTRSSMQIAAVMTVMIWILTPSFLILLSLVVGDKAFFEYSSTYYLTWVGAAATILPMMALVKLIIIVVRLKENVFTPIYLSVGGQLTVVMLGLAEKVKFYAPVDGSLQVFGLKALRAAIALFASTIYSTLGFSYTPVPESFALGDISSAWRQPAWVSASFIISAALYFYLRLSFGRDDLDLKQVAGERLLDESVSSLFRTGLTLVASAAVAAALMRLSSFVSISTPFDAMTLSTIVMLLTVTVILHLQGRGEA